MKLTETRRSTVVSFTFEIEGVEHRPLQYSRAGATYAPRWVRLEVRDGSSGSPTISGPVVLKGGGLSGSRTHDEHLYVPRNCYPTYVIEAIERAERAVRKTNKEN